MKLHKYISVLARRCLMLNRRSYEGPICVLVSARRCTMLNRRSYEGLHRVQDSPQRNARFATKLIEGYMEEGWRKRYVTCRTPHPKLHGEEKE